jgi:hypothetical protein
LYENVLGTKEIQDISQNLMDLCQSDMVRWYYVIFGLGTVQLVIYI